MIYKKIKFDLPRQAIYTKFARYSQDEGRRHLPSARCTVTTTRPKRVDDSDADL